MVTKRFSSRLLITFLICVFAFCSTGFLPGRFTLPVTRAVAAPPVVTGTINIWYSYGALDDSAFQIVLNNARAAFPSATINAFNMDYGSIFSDYNSAVQGGGGPDLFLWTADVIGDMARSGTIQNLDGPLSGRLSAYDSFAIEEITVEGHLYGVPKNSGGVALYYNKSTIATPPDDITDLYNLVDGGKKLSISMDGGAYYNFGLFAAFGGQLFAPNGYCIADQGGFVPAMQYWSQLKDAGATVALNYWNEGILAFRAGDLDMLIDGPWNLVDHENALGVDLGVAVLPEGPVGKSAPFVGVDAFFVNPNTSNLASAVEVALYMTSQPSMQTFTDIAKQIPVRDDVVAADPLVNIFADAAEQSYIRPSIPELGNYWVPFSQLFYDVLLNDVNPIKAVKTACDTMNIRNFFQVPDAVSIWYSYVQGGSEETAFLQILDNARAAFPDITIAEVFINFNDIFNQYEAYVGSGIGPDLIILPNDNLGNWARNGYVEDITSLLSGHLGSFTQTAIDGMKVDGQLYGVPESAKAVGLYYNKSRIPTPPTTTAGLLSLVQGGKKLALQRGGGVYFDFGLYYAFGGKLQNASGRCVAEQGGVIPTMKYLLALKTAGANVTDDYGQLGGAFMNGTIDMIFDGPWAYMDYKNALGSNLGVALLPAGPGGASKPLNGIDGYSANPNSLDIPTAVDVALFLTNQANSQIMTNYGGHVPIRTDVTSSDPLLNIFAQVSAAGLARPQTEQFGNYWGPFSQMYSDVFDGSVIPANGVIKACVEMNNLNGFSSYFTFSPLLRR